MILLALLLVTGQVAPAAPGTDRVGFDVQCMVASQAIADRVDGSMKAAVEMAVMFYFGRIDSVLSGAELEQRLGNEALKLEGKPLGPLLQQCGQFMQERGKTLQEIGAKLEAREKALQIR